MSEIQEDPNADQQANEEEQIDDGADDPWWKTALFALGLWALTIGFYVYITRFEAGEAGSVRIWWPVALLYNTLGKWPIVGIGGLGGLVLGVVAALDLRRSLKS